MDILQLSFSSYRDVMEKMIKLFFCKDDAEMETLFNDIFTVLLVFAEKRFQSNGGKFAAGGDDVGFSLSICFFLIIYLFSLFSLL